MQLFVTYRDDGLRRSPGMSVARAAGFRVARASWPLVIDRELFC
jgi:hypothetical protein